jgi:hypothetical protein
VTGVGDPDDAPLRECAEVGEDVAGTWELDAVVEELEVADDVGDGVRADEDGLAVEDEDGSLAGPAPPPPSALLGGRTEKYSTRTAANRTTITSVEVRART